MIKIHAVTVKINIKSNSSTRIDGIFFSNVLQRSWGNYVYKVKIISETQQSLI